MATYTESIDFIWQIAAGEAVWKKHELIEREHMFIAFCREVRKRAGQNIKEEVI